jgi:hypothetical protein
MMFIIATAIFIFIYLYVGWYQPMQNYKKMTFAEKRKFVKDLKKYGGYEEVW